MNILEKFSPLTLTASILLLLPSFAYAAGIDDLTNYQSPPAKVEPNNALPYTIQDIINILPNSLNNDGFYEEDGYKRTNQKAWQTEKYFKDRC